LLNSLNLNKFIEKFKEEDIDFVTAKKLSDDELKELGLPLGSRKKFLEAVQSSPSSTTTSTTTSTSSNSGTPPPASSSSKSSEFIPADPLAASQNVDLPLETRKNIAQTVEFIKKSNDRLRQFTGKDDYYVSIDYLAWYKACENFKGFLDPSSAHVKKQLGTCMNDYVFGIVSNFERFCKDPMCKDTLNAKCTKRVFVLEPVKSADQVKPNADSNQVLALSLQDGAIHCTVSRFLSLSGCFPHIAPLF